MMEDDTTLAPYSEVYPDEDLTPTLVLNENNNRDREYDNVYDRYDQSTMPYPQQLQQQRRLGEDENNEYDDQATMPYPHQQQQRVPRYRSKEAMVESLRQRVETLTDDIQSFKDDGDKKYNNMVEERVKFEKSIKKLKGMDNIYSFGVAVSLEAERLPQIQERVLQFKEQSKDFKARDVKEKRIRFIKRVQKQRDRSLKLLEGDIGKVESALKVEAKRLQAAKKQDKKLADLARIAQHDAEDEWARISAEGETLIKMAEEAGDIPFELERELNDLISSSNEIPAPENFPFVDLMRRSPKLEDILEELKQAQAVIAEYKKRAEETLQGYEDILTQLKDIKSKRKVVKGGSVKPGKVKGGFNAPCANINNPPRIRIFEMQPPPNIPLNELGSAAEARAWVQYYYDQQFHWSRGEPGETPDQCNFGDTIELSPWQRFVPEYIHPWNSELPGLLANASAGSGKSLAIAQVASRFGRAGWRVLVATKNVLRNDLDKTMFLMGGDVNINNMVYGCGIEFSEENSNEKKGNVQGEEREGVRKKGKLKLRRVGKHRRPGRQRVSQREQEELEGFEEEDEDIETTLSEVEGEEKEEKVLPYSKMGKEALKAMGVQLVRPASGGQTASQSFREMSFVIDKYGAEFTSKHGNHAPKDRPMERCVLLIDEAARIVSVSAEMAKNDIGDYDVIMKRLIQAHEATPEPGDCPKVVLFTATPVSTAPWEPILLLNMIRPLERWDDFYVKGATQNPKAREETTRRFLKMYVRKDGSLNRAALSKWEKLSKGIVSSISLYGDYTRFPRPEFVIQDVQMGKQQTQRVLARLEVDLKADEIKFVPGKGSVERATKEMLTPSGIKGSGGKAERDLRRKAPGTAEMLELLAQVDKDARAELRDVIQQQRGSGDRKIRARKMFLYVTSHNTATFGEISRELERQGYAHINPGTKSGGFQFKPQKHNYKGFITLLSDNKNEFKTNDPYYSKFNGLKYNVAMEAIFNDPENIDGRHCMLMVLSDNFREGISLAGIQVVFVLGVELSEAYLEQALARAMRFCRSKGTPWIPGYGWTIEVYLQSVDWDPSFKSKISQTVREAMQEVNPHGPKFYKSMDFMTRLVNASGVDADLFHEMNEVGQVQIPFADF